MADSQYMVSVERTIPAPAARIFDLLADPARHRDIDGSGTVQGTVGTPESRLSLGSQFGMSMRQGLRYSMVNDVVEFEENRRIAWKPRSANAFLARLTAGRVWRYELEPVGEGTLVRETWDVTHERGRALVFRMKAGRTRTAMERTLQRIEELTTSG